MADTATTRIFLLGYPRSGTTLLQSLLAAHPEVLSLPETFFFTHVVPSGRRWRLLRRAHPKARERLRELEGHGIEVAPRGLRETLPIATAGPTVARFVSSLDTRASRNGKSAWVEKTPIHLHHVDTIERYVSDARFVHMVRAGLPAIASLYSVTREHPEPWGGVRSLDSCVRRWRSDIRRSYDCVGKPDHAFVAYERLVDDPPAVLATLTQRLHLKSDLETIETMMANYAGTTSSIVNDEPWKSSVGSPIANRNTARVTTLFSVAEREEIVHRIAPEERFVAAMPFL